MPAYADGLAVGIDFLKKILICNHGRAVPTAAVDTVYANG
jgi:hypothetical protein